jgi:hypothetical protein
LTLKEKLMTVYVLAASWGSENAADDCVMGVFKSWDEAYDMMAGEFDVEDVHPLPAMYGSTYANDVDYYTWGDHVYGDGALITISEFDI